MLETVVKSKQRKRVSSDERKEQIRDAAFDVFSDYGFAGAKTSMIAKKANVSEALIFKHFVNKEALFEGAFDCVIDSSSDISKLMSYFESLEPSTQSLINIVYCLTFGPYVKTKYQGGKERKATHLLVQSLMAGDSAFAQKYFKEKCGSLPLLIGKSLKAGRENGDIVGSVTGEEVTWYLHNFSLGYFVSHAPEDTIFSFKVDEVEMLLNIVSMVLKIIGLKKPYDEYGVDFSVDDFRKRIF